MAATAVGGGRQFSLVGETSTVGALTEPVVCFTGRFAVIVAPLAKVNVTVTVCEGYNAAVRFESVMVALVVS